MMRRIAAVATTVLVGMAAGGCGSVADNVAEQVVDSALGDCSMGAVAVSALTMSSWAAVQAPDQYNDEDYQSSLEELRKYVPSELTDELDAWNVLMTDAIAKSIAGDAEGANAVLESADAKAAEQALTSYFETECR